MANVTELAAAAAAAAERERSAMRAVMAEVEALAAALFAFRNIQIEAAEARDAVLRGICVEPQPDPRPIGRFMVGSGIAPLVAHVYGALLNGKGPTLCGQGLPPAALLVLPLTEDFPGPDCWVLVEGEGAPPGSGAHFAEINREHTKRTIPLPPWATAKSVTFKLEL